MQRILLYYVVIAVVAAGYLVYHGARGVTAHTVAVAIPMALLFSVLLWLRWEVAPKMGRERRERERRQESGPDRG